jgi:parvulin-like peptidyl-prolyl isomerase
MPWESEEEPVRPGRDWARWMWIGVVVLIAAGVAMMFVPRQRDKSITEARVRHILVKVESQDEAAVQAALDKLNSLRERVLKGESLARLAEQYSDDTWSAPRGGDLGWVKRGELTEAIDNYIWTAPVGQVSNVLISSQGLHLVLIVERHFSSAESYEGELKKRVLEHGGTPESATQ